jgi:hypothetical protein
MFKHPAFCRAKGAKTAATPPPPPKKKYERDHTKLSAKDRCKKRKCTAYFFGDLKKNSALVLTGLKVFTIYTEL